MNLTTVVDDVAFPTVGRLKPVQTRSKVANARQVLDAGNVDSAEQLTVDALIDCPNSFPAYQLLGDVLDVQGRNQCAVSSYLGELPDSLGKKYLSADALHLSTGQESSRAIVHKSETTELPTPGGLSTNIEWKYKNKQVVSNETWVDTIDNGSSWHDGHNTVVFDCDGGIVESHTMGTPALVNQTVFRSSPQYVSERVFLLGARGGGNFYHWMTDILPKIGVLLDSGFVFRKSDRFVVPVFNKGFQKETLVSCGISLDQVYSVADSSPYFCSSELVVPRLTNVMGLHMGKWLTEFLERNLLVGTQQDEAYDSSGAAEKIFVSRDPSASNGRSIDNIELLNDIFAEKGFSVVYPERLSLVEQARCFNSAKTIFAPHGAGLTNIVFCKPETTIVEFYGAHIAPCYWAISALKRLRYFKEPCAAGHELSSASNDSAKSLSARRSAGFSVDIERLEQLFQLIGVN